MATPQRGLALLADAETAVARRLARLRGDSLFAVTLLHREAFAAYDKQQNTILSHHSVEMTLELAQLYGQLRGSAEGRADAANVLASLARELARGNSLELASDVPDRALDLERANELAADPLQLYVTAMRGDQRALDLHQADFEVRDRGVVQKIVSFARGDIPFTAVLMPDCSLSMQGGKLATAVAGARAFLDGVRPLDEAMLFAFSDRPRLLTPFASSPAALAASLADVEAWGGTAINDNLYLAVKLVQARQGRRTIVLLRDGVDVHSVLRMREVLEALRHTQTLVYWIRLSDSGGSQGKAPLGYVSPWRDAKCHEAELEVLERAAGESGGRVIAAEFDTDVEPAFREVLSELRDQYVLGYYPPGNPHDGSWHHVTVQVRRPGITLLSRSVIEY
jgi:Ca-activated chloride channel homolog